MGGGNLKHTKSIFSLAWVLTLILLVAAGCAKPGFLKVAGVGTGAGAKKMSRIVAVDPTGKQSLSLEGAAKDSMMSLLAKAVADQGAAFDLGGNWDMRLDLYGPVAGSPPLASVDVRLGDDRAQLGLAKGTRAYFYTVSRTEMERLVPFLLPAGFSTGVPAAVADSLAGPQSAPSARVFRVEDEGAVSGAGGGPPAAVSYLVVTGAARPGYEVALKRVDVRAGNSYVLIYARQALPAGASALPAAQAGTQLTLPKSASVEVGVEGAMVPVERLRTAKVNLYFGNASGDKILRESRPVVATVETGLQAAALAELLRGPKTAGLHALLSKEARVLSVTVRDRIAYADFSRELVTKFGGGSMTEALAIASIADTLTDFAGVRRVQILIEGRPVETLGGHMDISQPLPRNEVLLAK